MTDKDKAPEIEDRLLIESVLKRLSPAKYLADNEPQAPIAVAQLIFDATLSIESLITQLAEVKTERDALKAKIAEFIDGENRGSIICSDCGILLDDKYDPGDVCLQCFEDFNGLTESELLIND